MKKETAELIAVPYKLDPISHKTLVKALMDYGATKPIRSLLVELVTFGKLDMADACKILTDAVWHTTMNQKEG